MHEWREPPVGVRSHVGHDWLERSGMVGTADVRNSFLFHRRVVLQIKIGRSAEGHCSVCIAPYRDAPDASVCVHEGARIDYSITDIIVDARCYTENDETDHAGCTMLSALAANTLIGKTITDALCLRDDEFIAGETVPWHAGCNGQPLLFAEALRAALLDWSKKATGRAERLPPNALPEAAYRPPLWRRALRIFGI